MEKVLLLSLLGKSSRRGIEVRGSFVVKRLYLEKYQSQVA